MTEMMGQTVDILIEDEMKDSYLNYAMSVIVSRALPDVRDGLKPSQRRILIAMNDLNLGPRSKFRKCAKIAGDTSGNYHPHGEQVIYPTLVRMAQDFNCRYVLVDGQGNFGSIDGDPPAAMRYTEARLSNFASEMLRDMELDTVDFVPNYDETRREPTVLPSRFPNLLCNGASGIAVGMATSIPPHNLGEVCDALTLLIRKPDASLDEIIEIIKGPDFPTGAIICGSNQIRKAYETGRGILTLRARGYIEDARGGRKNIVFTEIPYQLQKGKIIERIADLVKSGKISGVADVRDESDREGMRIVVEIKRGENENVILNQLYNSTPLQSSFSIIMIALVNGRPQTLNLKELLKSYIDHRMVVIKRRTSFLLQKAEHECHILEGLRIAIASIDEVIELIKKSPDLESARAALVKRFKLTQEQTDAILQMRLHKLTGLERKKIDGEYDALQKNITEYREILASDRRVLDIIVEDLQELKKKYGDPRRTEIVGEVEGFNIEDLIAEEEVVVILSHEGYIKRMPLTTYRLQKRGGHGIVAAETKEGDFIEHLFVASTHDYILFFTDMGKVHWLKVYDIPELPRSSKGRALVNLLRLDEGESITSAIPVRSFEKGHLVMATERGIIKKTALSEYGNPKKGGIIAISLEEGDKLVKVRHTVEGQELLLGTEQGTAIRFREKELRSQGRVTRGVRAIKLRKGDKVRDMVVVDNEATLLTVCEKGYGKRTPFSEYRVQNRAGTGIKNIKVTPKNGRVVGLLDVREGDEVFIVTAQGMIIRVSIDSIRTMGRNTQGVKLITLHPGDVVNSTARLREIHEDESRKSPPAISANEEQIDSPDASDRLEEL